MEVAIVVICLCCVDVQGEATQEWRSRAGRRGVRWRGPSGHVGKAAFSVQNSKGRRLRA